MNDAVYTAALRKGCSPRQAEAIATYVIVDSIAQTAQAMKIGERTAKQHLMFVRDRLGVPHLAAAVAKLLS